jgi:hypothetical protein
MHRADRLFHGMATFLAYPLTVHQRRRYVMDRTAIQS